MPHFTGNVHNYSRKDNSIVIINDLTASAWYSLNVQTNEIAFFDSSVVEPGQTIQSVSVILRTVSGAILTASGTPAAPLKIDITGYPTANEWRIDYSVTTTDGSTNTSPGFFFDPTDDSQTSGNVNPNCPALRDKTILEGTGVIPVIGGVVFMGGYNATTNVPDLVAPSGGSVNSGAQWVVDIAGLAFFGEELEIGDSLISRIDNPTMLSDWIITQANITSLDDVPDGTNFIRVPRVKYDTDYFVSSDFGNNANDGLNEERPFETLEAALDAAEAGTGGTIHILNDATYEIQAASGTRTTTKNITLIAKGAKLVGPAGGLVWRLPTNNMEALRIDGTNLIFEPQGTGQVFQHIFHDIDNPETLYTGRSGNTNPRYHINAQYSFGTGRLIEATNGVKAFYTGQEVSAVISSATDAAPFEVDGNNTSIQATVQNLDVNVSGGGGEYAIIANNDGAAFIWGQCSSSNNGAKASNNAKVFTFLSSTGGFALPNTEATGGRIISHSMGEGLNFSELDAVVTPALTDLFNLRQGIQQYQVTGTQLQALITAGFVTVATVQDVTGAKTFTAPLTVKDGTGSGLAANAIADCFVFTSSNINAGMSLMTIAGGNSNVFFGETGNSDKAAHIQYIGSVNELRLGASNVNVQRISSTNVLFETKIQVREGGIFRFDVETDGTLTVGDTPTYELLVTDDDDIPNKKYVDDAVGVLYPQTTTKTSGDSPYAAVNKDFIICDAVGGNIVIDLPAAASSLNTHISIKKVDASANTVTIDGNLAETIDGGLTAVLTTQWEMITVICDGSNWFIGN